MYNQIKSSRELNNKSKCLEKKAVFTNSNNKGLN